MVKRQVLKRRQRRSVRRRVGSLKIKIEFILFTSKLILYTLSLWAGKIGEQEGQTNQRSSKMGNGDPKEDPDPTNITRLLLRWRHLGGGNVAGNPRAKLPHMVTNWVPTPTNGLSEITTLRGTPFTSGPSRNRSLVY